MPSCIVLFSGGLDSALALRLMAVQGVAVTAFYARNCFQGGGQEAAAREADLRRRALVLGAAGLEVRDLTGEVIELVKRPRYGLGRNMNPCLDCRLRTLREAAALRQEMNADFVATGEVIGQRPMSQRKDAMRTVLRHAKDWGLEGLLLRPLCAQLLEPTIPEERGWVDRSRLLGLSGRGRGPQMELAREWGITEFPSPAGGCLLTDPGYGARLRELNRARPAWTARDAELLKIGRHFRAAPGLRVVASRDAGENEALKTALPAGAVVCVTAERPGAMVALVDEREDGARAEDADWEAALAVARGLAVRYSRYREAGVADIGEWRQGVPDSRAAVPGVRAVDPETLEGRI